MRCAAGSSTFIPPSLETPLRFDFFGKQLESIRTFDPDTQRTTGTLKRIALAPMSEVLLNEDTHQALPCRATRRRLAATPATIRSMPR